MEEKFYWLGWSVFPGVGPGKFRLLIEKFESAKNAWQASSLDLKSVIGEKLTENFDKFRINFSIENYAKKLVEKKVWFLTQKDPKYPQLLLQTDKPPILLFGKGSIDARGPVASFPPAHLRQDYGGQASESAALPLEAKRSGVGSPSSGTTPRKNKSKSPPSFKALDTLGTLDTRTIAVVGTRKITSYGREVTESLTRDLVQNGFVIVSGLALGVDAVAHKTAIDNNGKTIAVLGCGVDLCYPSSNKKLYEEIVNGHGAVISEFPIGMTPNVGSFPSRNRIIAGMSQGVLVTEGAEDSGSLITAECGLKYGRKVFAVPGPITSNLAKGPNSLISKGAKLVVSSRDILDEFQISNVGAGFSRPDSGQARMTPRFQNLTEEEGKILEILENEGKHFDEIVRKMELDSAKVGSLLTVMEIKGMIKSLENGYFKLIQ